MNNLSLAIALAAEINAVMISRTLTGVCLFCLFAVASSKAYAELNARITLTNDYVYRGLSQSDAAAILQGALEYQFDSGAFAGVWLSQVDYGFDRAEGDESDASTPYADAPYTGGPLNGALNFPNLEVDYFIGFENRLSKRFAYDVTLVHHDYRGSESGLDFDWTELLATAYVYDHWVVSVGVADRWLGEKQTTSNLEVTYLYPLPLGLIFDTTVGVQAAKELQGNTMVYIDSGVSRAFGKLSARLAFSAVERSSREQFGDRAENKWLASLAWSF